MSTDDIIDGDLARGFLRRAVSRASGGEDFLLQHVLADVCDRLATIARNFSVAALVAPVAPKQAELLQAGGKIGTLHVIEGFNNTGGLPGLMPGSCDLVISLLGLQVENDVPGVMVQMRRALRPDGLMLAVMLGGETLKELRLALTEAETELYGGASPRVLPFVDVRVAGALLQRVGFALPVTDIQTLTVRYASALELMRDIRGMGGQNALHARSRKPASRRFFQRVAQVYAQKFSDPDGRVRATFSFVSMSGWAPHESQQKPLMPGSGKMSLAAILDKK